MYAVLREMLARLMIKHGNQQMIPFRGSERSMKRTRKESLCHPNLSEEPHHVSGPSAQSRITAWEPDAETGCQPIFLTRCEMGKLRLHLFVLKAFFLFLLSPDRVLPPQIMVAVAA